MDQYVGPGTVLVDRSLLMEAQMVRVSVNSNNRRVYTMRKGLAGRSKGPTEVEIQIDTAIPEAGFEQDYISKVVENADVSVVVVVAGVRYQYDGWIDQVSHEQNQDAPASASFTVISGPPQTL